MNFRKLAAGFATVALLASNFAFAATMPDNSKSPKNFFAQGYAAQWVSQTQSGTTDQLYAPNSGDTVKITFVFKNTGTETWNKEGADQQVCFNIYKDPNRQTAPSGTGFDTPSDPNFGQSFWSSSTWANNHRPSCVKETTVAPGANGTFDVEFKIPSSAPTGTYYEDISLASGPYWIANPTNGDPLGVAHVWAGFKVKGSEIPAGEESTMTLDCFDNELTLEQSTACYVAAADKFGDPIEGRDATQLYLEFLSGSAQFFDALGTGDNIAELDQDLTPGIYPFAVQAGTTAETVKVRATDLEVIPQVSQTMSLVVTDKNMIAEVFPDTLTVGSITRDEAVINVYLVDANGDPQTGKNADLKAEVIQGDASVVQWNPAIGAGVAADPRFSEVQAYGDGTGIYTAKVRVGTTAGPIKIKITDLITGASQTVELDAMPATAFVDLFPPVVFSNDSGVNGTTSLIIGILDANGKPYIAEDISGIIEVTEQLTLAGAVLDCDGVGGGINPTLITVNPGALGGLYGCQYTAPAGGDRVKSAKMVPLKVRNTVTGDSFNVNLQVNIGDNQSTGIPTKMEVKRFGDKLNVNEVDDVAILVNLADTKNNLVSGEAADFDIDSEWDAFAEITLTTATGIYYSNNGTGYDSGDLQGEEEESDIDYQDTGTFLDDVEVKETITTKVYDYVVDTVAFPPSVASNTSGVTDTATLSDNTVLVSKISNAYGGKAASVATTSSFGGACAAGQICYDNNSSDGVDVAATLNAANTDLFGIYFAALESDDDKDIEVDVDLGSAELDEQINVIVPVDADNSISLSAFPENIVRGFTGSVIIKLQDQDGAPVNIDDADVDAGGGNKFEADSEEDDNLSFDDIPEDINGGATDGNLMDLMFELQLNPTTLVLDAASVSAGSLNEAAGEVSGGIFFLPYGAPIDIKGDITDCATVTYDGVEKVEEQTCFNVQA